MNDSEVNRGFGNEESLDIQTIRKNTAKKNYLYNMVYQVFALIVPLVVTPYISRVLGSNGIGEYAFSYSLISYFALFGMFGFGYYAQREIARFQADRYKQSIIFWEIVICRLFTVAIPLLLNNVFVFLGFYGKYGLLMFIFNIYLIAIMVDVAFFFQGNEEFKTIAIVNVVVKAVGVLAIFLFVKSEKHVWVYTVCQCGILLGSNSVLWLILPRKLVKVSVKDLHVFRHFLPSLRLFIPTIAVSIYTMLDRTLIGLLVQGETIRTMSDGAIEIVKISDTQNGYYEQSEKIVKMALTVLTSLGTVMIPKNSFHFKRGDYERVKQNVMVAVSFVFIVGIPMVFGLMGIASNFTPWYFGPGYEAVPKLIMVFSPLILVIGLNNVFGIQYMLPAGKDSAYSSSVIFGACINLTLNLFLIPCYEAVGAAIASVIAETSILLFQMFYLRNDFDFRLLLIPFIKYSILGCLMFGIVYFLSKNLFPPSIINSFILVIIGVLFYFISLLVVKDKIVIGTIKEASNRILLKKKTMEKR